MPRDVTPPHAVEVDLPAGRRGRIVPADDAGEFAVHCHSTWIDQLVATGWLSSAEADAAARLHDAFEATGLRPRLASKFDGVFVDHVAGADAQLELMDEGETKAWRRLHRLLGLVPAAQRHQVQAVACWNERPWCVRSLRAGLRVLADALRQPRR